MTSVEFVIYVTENKTRHYISLHIHKKIRRSNFKHNLFWGRSQRNVEKMRLLVPPVLHYMER
jgi:hypothetical protein